jgi:xanthine dehydrogenase accessory factor
MSIAPSPIDVLNFLAGSSPDCVLVTLVAVHGSASRAVGTQMAVAADGSACGSFSGGCIDAAVIAEALDALADGIGRTVRYGAGSPFIDVKLPCGGGIDLLFTPRPDAGVVATVLSSLGQRQPVSVTISAEGFSLDGGAGFTRRYYPALRIVALGQGEELSALAQLALSFGTETVVVIPAEQAPSLPPLPGVQVHPAQQRTKLPDITTDPWTALLFLFHDRDWEEFLLPEALARPSFYCGAIGSPKTQSVRREALIAAGVAPAHLARLRGPIGLIPSTRDPATLALSILAEIVAEYHTLVAQ